MGLVLSESQEISAGAPCPLCGEPLEHTANRVALLESLLGEGLCRQLGIYRISEDFLLSVVIPVYNERDTLEELVSRVRAVPIRKEVILVDDGSTDGTRDLLPVLETQDDIRVFYHEANQGKGAALRTGFNQAKGNVVVVQDADLEYDPNEYPRLIQPILEGKADVVYGSRFIGESHRVLYFWHYLGNRFVTTLSNMFTNLNLTDMETCYKVFRREVIQEVAPRLKQNRFGFEPEITAKIARQRDVRVYEIPISYSGRTYDQGKKITWRDGISAIWHIIRYSVAD
jgi:glycosyltransferase involved in cell wall biosynthesis